MNNPTCHDCRFFDLEPEPAGAGHCFVNPPALIVVGTEVRHLLPVTHRDNLVCQYGLPTRKSTDVDDVGGPADPFGQLI